MSLLFTARSHQRVRVPRDAAIDDLAEWSVLADLYPTTLSVPDRCDVFKKSHPKRVGTDNGTNLLVKQNYSTGVIQYAGTFFDTANVWYCACCTVTTARGFIYKGKFSDALSEITYGETTATHSGGIETDVTDAAYPGDVIFGNEAGRFGSERGYAGRIARLRWWSAPLTLAEFRQEYHAPWAVRHANLEGDYHLGWQGRERVIDYSGNRRHGAVVGF